MMLSSNMKVLILGDKNTGKHFLIRKLVVKCDCYFMKLEEKDKSRLVPNYYHVVLLTLDLSSTVCVCNIPAWIDFIKNELNYNNIILVGTKCDQDVCIGNNVISYLCDTYKTKYIAVSTKTEHNITELKNMILNSVRANYSTFDDTNNENIRLISGAIHQKRSGIKKILLKIFCFDDDDVN